MNLSEVNELITFNSRASTTQFTNSTRITLVNVAIDEVHTEILASMDEWDFDDKNSTDFPILTTNLKADTQDYSLPFNQTGANDDIVKIKRLEVKMSNRFYKAEPFDINERGRSVAETTDLANDFVESAPRYDFTNGSVFLYPVPTKDVTGGLKIWIHRSMKQFVEADLSDSDKYMGFDRQFHKLVPLKVAFDWVSKKTTNRGLASDLKGEIIELTEKLKTFYGSKQEDREIIIKGAYIDYDTDRGNNNTNRTGPT